MVKRVAEKFMFLSPEWIREALRAVQGARSKDEEFSKLASDYSLNLAYIITDAPPIYSSLTNNTLYPVGQRGCERFQNLNKTAKRKKSTLL